PAPRAARHGGLPAARSRVRLGTDAAGARGPVSEAHPRRAGPAVDGVHARPESRRVHGLSPIDRARRGRLDPIESAELRRLPRAAGDPSRTPADSRCQLSTARSRTALLLKLGSG